MTVILRRAGIVLFLPLAMFCGFFQVLVRDVGRAFRYAYLEAMIEFESARKIWRE